MIDFFGERMKESYSVPRISFDIESTPITIDTADSVQRTRWASKDAWVFTKDEGKLLKMIPDYE